MLPVESVSADILEALKAQDVILSAPPGAGKSTYLPLQLLRSDHFAGQKILMLQPRRVAARSIAHYLAAQWGESVGKTIGYRVRGEARTSSDTRLEIITEGLLTRMLQDDPTLEGVGLVIFDEFHERNVHGDFALSLCLEVQQALRDDLRLLVMSATLHVNPLSRLLPEAKHIESEGRQYPIDIRYEPVKADTDFVAQIARTVLKAVDENEGSVLVFMPGAGEIRRLADALHSLPKNTDLALLYGELGLKEQQAAIRPAQKGRRKVVLATNIAETSLTIEGISVVVDSGKEKAAQFDLQRGVSQLQQRWISQASAVQRAGRAGRLGPGVCYRLWSAEQHQRLNPHIRPQLFDTDLAPFVLESAVWGSDIRQLPLLDPPSDAQVSQARALLIRLRAIDKGGHITSHGKALAAMGSHPRMAHMMLSAAEEDTGLGWLACILAAVLESPVIQVRKQSVSVNAQLHWLARNPGHPHWQTAGNWAKRIKLNSRPSNFEPYVSDISRVLLMGFPDFLAKSRGDGRFKLANGSGCVLPADDALVSSRYLVVGQLVLFDRAEARVGLAEGLTERDVFQALPDQVESRTVCQIDKHTHKLTVKSQKCVGELVLSESPAPLPEGGQRVEMWCHYLRQQGLAALQWNDAVTNWLQRVSIARKLDSEEWPDVSAKRLTDTLETWLGPFLHDISSWQQLKSLNWLEVLKTLLDWHQQQALDTLLPVKLEVPTGNRYTLRYESADKVVLAVKMQEMYGLGESPRIANGRLSVLLELLSPAGRPLQTTGDLGGFWKGSYLEVQKEMKGRYPKHYWPDDPANAVATDRTKKRMEQRPG